FRGRHRIHRRSAERRDVRPQPQRHQSHTTTGALTLESAAMQYRELGKTGIKVSAIGFGAWAIGGPSEASGAPLGWGRTTDEESLAAIRRARDLGVTFFDTADSYGFGRSESLLGIVLSRKRSDVVIATKVGVVRTSTG